MTTRRIFLAQDHEYAAHCPIPALTLSKPQPAWKIFISRPSSGVASDKAAVLDGDGGHSQKLRISPVLYSGPYLEAAEGGRSMEPAAKAAVAAANAGGKNKAMPRWLLAKVIELLRALADEAPVDANYPTQPLELPNPCASEDFYDLLASNFPDGKAPKVLNLVDQRLQLENQKRSYKVSDDAGRSTSVRVAPVSVACVNRTLAFCVAVFCAQAEIMLRLQMCAPVCED